MGLNKHPRLLGGTYCARVLYTDVYTVGLDCLLSLCRKESSTINNNDLEKSILGSNQLKYQSILKASPK